jgi:hypothetical protein
LAPTEGFDLAGPFSEQLDSAVRLALHLTDAAREIVVMQQEIFSLRAGLTAEDPPADEVVHGGL